MDFAPREINAENSAPSQGNVTAVASAVPSVRILSTSRIRRSYLSLPRKKEYRAFIKGYLHPTGDVLRDAFNLSYMNSLKRIYIRGGKNNKQ